MLAQRRSKSSPFSLTILLTVAVVIAIFVGIMAQVNQSTDPRSQAAEANLRPGLHVVGTSATASDNTRFVFKGVNIEFYRDNGCRYVTENTWKQKDAIVAKMKSVGINAVRLNYKANWLDDSNNIDQFLELMQLYAQNGIYVMPSDHTFTGKNLVSFDQSSYPLFAAIVQGARARGFEDYLIMNPYNEPYGVDQTASKWSSWISTNNQTLDYLRKDLSFKGMVVLDTKDWAANFDIASLHAVQQHDSELLGGQAKIIFSNHWYPNISQGKITQTLAVANQVPVLIGEIGQYNATPLNPQYVKDALNNVVTTGIPNGHNGVFPWMWSWCDSNNMTKAWDNLVDPSSYGQLIIDNYYSKVAASSQPGAGNPVLVTPTPTPVPSVQPSPLPTPSPIMSPIPSPKPSPSPVVTGDPQNRGLTGMYYDGTSWDNSQLKLTRIDPLIAFKWGNSHPTPSVGDDTYSVRWTGQLTAPATGWYGISAKFDDGVIVTINKKLLIWDRDKTGLREGKAAVYLEKDMKYPIKVEYVEKSGNAEIGLYWKYGSMKDRQLIPSRYFTPN